MSAKFLGKDFKKINFWHAAGNYVNQAARCCDHPKDLTGGQMSRVIAAPGCPSFEGEEGGRSSF